MSSGNSKTSLTCGAVTNRNALVTPSCIRLVNSANFGLAIPVPSPRLTASGALILPARAGHGGQVVANFVFTEGLPAFGLAVISVYLTRHPRWVLGAGVFAAVVSFTQCVLGIMLARATAHLLYEAVNRLDGVKMFAIAAVALAAGHSSTRCGSCVPPSTASCRWRPPAASASPNRSTTRMRTSSTRWTPRSDRSGLGPDKSRSGVRAERFPGPPGGVPRLILPECPRRESA